MVLAAHQSLAATHPGILTIIVPRHPERGGAIAELAGGAPQRSLGAPPPGAVESGWPIRWASLA